MASTTTTASLASDVEGGWYAKIAADYLAAKSANLSLTYAAYCRSNGIAVATLVTALRHTRAPKRRPDLPDQTNFLDDLDGKEADRV